MFRHEPTEQDQTIVDITINKNLEVGDPYCQECSKRFSQQHNLKPHINKIHGGSTTSKGQQVCNPIVSTYKAAKIACDNCEKNIQGQIQFEKTHRKNALKVQY